jgi:hypothetical protein
MTTLEQINLFCTQFLTLVVVDLRATDRCEGVCTIFYFALTEFFAGKSKIICHAERSRRRAAGTVVFFIVSRHFLTGKHEADENRKRLKNGTLQIQNALFMDFIFS